MAKYKAPLRDLRFVYYELFDGNQLAGLPGFEDATEELVMAAAEEMGRICEQVLHPLSAPGDREGCHYENGQVRTDAVVRKSQRPGKLLHSAPRAPEQRDTWQDVREQHPRAGSCTRELRACRCCLPPLRFRRVT